MQMQMQMQMQIYIIELLKDFVFRCGKQGLLWMKKNVAGLWGQKFNQDVINQQ